MGRIGKVAHHRNRTPSQGHSLFPAKAALRRLHVVPNAGESVQGAYPDAQSISTRSIASRVRFKLLSWNSVQLLRPAQVQCAKTCVNWPIALHNNLLSRYS